MACNNIGKNNPVDLMDYIDELEKVLGKTAKKNYLPLQVGDVPVTYVDVTDLEQDFGYKPSTPVHQGIRNFANWYKDYYSQ